MSDKAMTEEDISNELDKTAALQVLWTVNFHRKIYDDPNTSPEDAEEAWRNMQIDKLGRKALDKYKDILNKKKVELESKKKKGFLGIGKKDLTEDEQKTLKEYEEQIKIIQQVQKTAEANASREGYRAHYKRMRDKERQKEMLEESMQRIEEEGKKYAEMSKKDYGVPAESPNIPKNNEKNVAFIKRGKDY